VKKRRGVSQRIAAWCTADDPLRCGVGPLARYIYVLKLAGRGIARLIRRRS